MSSSIPGGGVGSWRWVGRRQHFEAGRQSLDLAEHATTSEPALDRGRGTAGRPVSDCVIEICVMVPIRVSQTP